MKSKKFNDLSPLIQKILKNLVITMTEVEHLTQKEFEQSLIETKSRDYGNKDEDGYKTIMIIESIIMTLRKEGKLKE